METELCIFDPKSNFSCVKTFDILCCYLYKGKGSIKEKLKTKKKIVLGECLSIKN